MTELGNSCPGERNVAEFDATDFSNRALNQGTGFYHAPLSQTVPLHDRPKRLRSAPSGGRRPPQSVALGRSREQMLVDQAVHISDLAQEGLAEAALTNKTLKLHRPSSSCSPLRLGASRPQTPERIFDLAAYTERRAHKTLAIEEFSYEDGVAPAQWDVLQVCDWVDFVGLSQFRRNFAASGVSGRVLVKLTREQLRDDLGIKDTPYQDEVLHQVEHLLQLFDSSGRRTNRDMPAKSAGVLTPSTPVGKVCRKAALQKKLGYKVTCAQQMHHHLGQIRCCLRGIDGLRTDLTPQAALMQEVTRKMGSRVSEMESDCTTVQERLVVMHRSLSEPQLAISASSSPAKSGTLCIQDVSNFSPDGLTFQPILSPKTIALERRRLRDSNCFERNYQDGNRRQLALTRKKKEQEVKIAKDMRKKGYTSEEARSKLDGFVKRLDKYHEDKSFNMSMLANTYAPPSPSMAAFPSKDVMDDHVERVTRKGAIRKQHTQ